MAAQPETVFAYFVDPTKYTQWMGSHAVLQPEPGGSYRVSMRDGIEAAGEFVELDPPHRLVFTWGWTNDTSVAPGSTRVVVSLQEEDGGTRVLLRHYGLPSGEQRAHHTTGWEMYLGRLEQRLDGRDPGPDPNS